MRYSLEKLYCDVEAIYDAPRFEVDLAPN